MFCSPLAINKHFNRLPNGIETLSRTMIADPVRLNRLTFWHIGYTIPYTPKLFPNFTKTTADWIF